MGTWTTQNTKATCQHLLNNICPGNHIQQPKHCDGKCFGQGQFIFSSGNAKIFHGLFSFFWWRPRARQPRSDLVFPEVKQFTWPPPALGYLYWHFCSFALSLSHLFHHVWYHVFLFCLDRREKEAGALIKCLLKGLNFPFKKHSHKTWVIKSQHSSHHWTVC